MKNATQKKNDFNKQKKTRIVYASTSTYSLHYVVTRYRPNNSQPQ